jgi:hypothetical protein
MYDFIFPFLLAPAGGGARTSFTSEGLASSSARRCRTHSLSLALALARGRPLGDGGGSMAGGAGPHARGSVPKAKATEAHTAATGRHACWADDQGLGPQAARLARSRARPILLPRCPPKNGTHLMSSLTGGRGRAGSASPWHQRSNSPAGAPSRHVISIVSLSSRPAAAAAAACSPLPLPLPLLPFPPTPAAVPPAAPGSGAWHAPPAPPAQAPLLKAAATAARPEITRGRSCAAVKGAGGVCSAAVTSCGEQGGGRSGYGHLPGGGGRVQIWHAMSLRSREPGAPAPNPVPSPQLLPSVPPPDAPIPPDPPRLRAPHGTHLLVRLHHEVCGHSQPLDVGRQLKHEVATADGARSRVGACPWVGLGWGVRSGG